MKPLIAVLFTVALDRAPQEPSDRMARLIQSAHQQVGTTLHYDGRYRPISFPGGDVPIDRGVCTDVLVRAYRGIGIDLQVLVHHDMSRAFRSYPQLWGLSRPDPNIDHRRVPNLATFFKRHGESLPVSSQARDYLPGDIVTWRLPSGRPHIGLVSNRKEGERLPIIHNIGSGAQVEDILFSYPITGHYRYLPGKTQPTVPAGAPENPADRSPQLRSVSSAREGRQSIDSLE